MKKVVMPTQACHRPAMPRCPPPRISSSRSHRAARASSAHRMIIRCAGAAAWVSWRWTSGPPLIASFPVELDDQIMLATSRGQSIRVPVQGISFRSRNAGGVKVFDTRKGEKVVSVAWIAEQADEDNIDVANVSGPEDKED